MKAIEKKRRRTIQEITIARRKNAAGMGKERGIRVLKKSKKSKKESTIAAIKDSQAPDESGARSISESEQPTKESKNRLLATVKRRKKRSCASCWGN